MRLRLRGVAMALPFLLLWQAPASAHDVRLGSSPSDGETLTSTYREFVLPSPGADAPAAVTLRSLRSGAEVPESAPALLRRAQTVWSPPSLDHGTYVLDWEFVAGGTLVRESIHFNVSRASHEVGMLPGGAVPLPYLLSAGLLLALAAAAQVLSRARWLALLPASSSLLLPLASDLPAALPWQARPLPLAALLLAALWRPSAPIMAGFAAALLAFPPSGGAGGLLLYGMYGLLLTAVLAAFSVSPSARPLLLGSAAAVPLVFLRLGPSLFELPWLLLAAASLALAATAVAAVLRPSVPLRPLLAVGALALAASTLPAPAFSATPGAAVSASPSTCFTRGDYLAVQRCLEVAFSAATFDGGVHAALQGLDGLVRDVPQARFHCHAASHAIGRAAFDLAGDVPSAFRSGFDVCDFGFFHGVIEASASGMGDEEFSEVVRSACIPLLDDGPLFFMQCTHGLGHAAARRTNNDMLAGLAFCDLLRDAPMPERMRPAALNGCGTGVTMEWFAVTGLVADPSQVASPAVSRQRDVCFLVEPRWQAECFEYVGNTLDSSRPEASLLELADWCRSTPHQFSCAVGLMRAAAGTSVAPDAALRVCESAVPDRSGDCLFEFLVTVATTVHYSPAAVDAACLSLPAGLSDGPGSLCARAREESADVLAAGGTLLPG